MKPKPPTPPTSPGDDSTREHNVVHLLPKRAANAPRKRYEDVDPAEAKDAILMIGNVLASAFDLFVHLESGDDFVSGAKKAIRRGRRRARAILRSDKAPDDEDT